jgi:hypothetical protein
MIGCVLTALAVQSALRSRREARLARQLSQTEWLCEGGLVRAAQALQKSPEYTGEVWQPKLNIEPYTEAQVQIKVIRPTAKSETTSEKTTDDASKNPSAEPVTLTIYVRAHLDSTTDGDGPMQRTRSLTIQRPSESDSKTEKAE